MLKRNIRKLYKVPIKSSIVYFKSQLEEIILFEFSSIGEILIRISSV